MAVNHPHAELSAVDPTGVSAHAGESETVSSQAFLRTRFTEQRQQRDAAGQLASTSLIP